MAKLINMEHAHGSQEERPAAFRSNSGGSNFQIIGNDRLSHLPLEILAEVLIFTASPRDVLAVARTCKHMCHTLVHPDSSHIWQKARKGFLTSAIPVPLPAPTPNFTEASYAAFIFDGGKCENCGHHTKKLYYSFALRLRLCGKVRCFDGWMKKDGFDVREESSSILGWMLASEPMNVRRRKGKVVQLRPSSRGEDWNTTPCFGRASEWRPALNDHRALLKRDVADESLKTALSGRERQVRDIMQHAYELSKWKYFYGSHLDTIRVQNIERADGIANHEGWRLYDLLNTPSYQALHQCRTISCQFVSASDFESIKERVNQELGSILEKRDVRVKSVSTQDNVKAIIEHYERMKGETVMPTLEIFRSMPTLRVFTNAKSDGKLNLKNELSQNGLVQNQLRDEVSGWVEKAKAELGGMLGFPGYKQIGTSTLHPVERLTARFRCKKCAALHPNVPAANKSLNFADVCSHECWGLNRKKRKRPTWASSQFVVDLKAVNFLKEVLRQEGIDERLSESLSVSESAAIRCLACPGDIRMFVDDGIRHCQRHEVMGLELIEEAGIEHGLCDSLLAPGNPTGVREMGVVRFGCRHCISRTADGEMGGGAKNPKTPKCMMNFHGLRSHLKAVHGVMDIGDEDVYRGPEMNTACPQDR